jgi:hypothetical protein
MANAAAIWRFQGIFVARRGKLLIYLHNLAVIFRQHRGRGPKLEVARGRIPPRHERFRG